MGSNKSVLLQSNNPVEVDQIVHALENVGIKAKVDGRKALEIGNVELTGITGASILVDSDKLAEAKKILVDLGLDYDGPRTRDSMISYAYVGLFIIFAIMIVTMIVIALK